MEQEILQTLQEIRGILLVIVVLFFIWVGAIVYTAMAESLPFLKPKSINDKAQALFDEGRFPEIVELCEKHLSKKPNHLNSVWWLAKAKYNLKEYKHSEKLFNSLLEKEPNWQTEYITPYLDKLSELNETANKASQPTAESGG